MDNVCHTLIGAALGEAGMKRLTRYGSATLMMASNLPDIDVAVMATRIPSVSFRRGWTHGILADALLPVALAALVMAFDKWGRGSFNEDMSSRNDSRPHFLQLLLLSYVGVILHVLFDLLNNYGVRLLMPYSGHWFYGDALFIVDPWLYLMLGGGVWLARKRGSVLPARRALMASAVYVAVMVVSARAARTDVMTDWVAEHGAPPQKLMVGPVFADPLHKQVIVDRGDGYLEGTFSWLSRGVRFDEPLIPKNSTTPEAAAARENAAVRALLVWSRFPYYEVEQGRVVVKDVRFGRFIAASGGAASPGS